MRNDHLRSNTRQPRSSHRGDARTGAWALAVLATFGASTALGGCVSDPDCGVCDPENLILETVAGVNYAGKVVKLLGPDCEGDNCPGEIKRGNYFVEKVYPCPESDDALKSERGTDEWCRVSPLIVNDGLQFIFNNLLDPQSVELVRKSPVNPQLFEVYDWKTRIVSLEGPISRYNGDYFRAGSQTAPDRVTRLVNLSCVDNLAAQGQPFNHTTASEVCDGTHVVDGKTIPLKMELAQPIRAAKGEVDTRRVSQSCTTPQDGVDTCCDACDFELSVNVAKYGLKSGVQLDEMTEAELSQKANPNDGSAIKCDPMMDKFAQCAGFVPHVYRGDEVRAFEYVWTEQGKTIKSRIPLQDKIRETHPANRPFGDGLPGDPQRTVPCETREDCAKDPGPNLPGMDCVGRVGNSSKVCSDPADPMCQFRCEAEWFVECRADKDTTGAQGYCVDKRWNGQGVAACFTTTTDYPICLDGECTQTNASDGDGRRFAYADADGDNFVSAIEACRGALSEGQVADNAACDPYFQSKVQPNNRYDRKETLPSTSRNCVCEDDPANGCEDIVAKLCHVDGDPEKPLVDEKRGQYALKFVSRNGGVIYDPAVKGVLFLPADLGSMPRSFTETCSAGRAKGAGALNIKDGWRGNDSGFFENFENFDRSMCSSSTYKIKFEPQPGNEGKLDAIQYIRDKVGNYLVGKSTYIIKTPDFHVVPGSGFPTDNLRIGACDDFELRFSNKYDMSPQNVAKLAIVELGGTDEAPVEGKVVAGGPGCAATKEALEGGQGKVPCLTVNVRDQEIGSISVLIDAKEFGAVLKPGQRYRLHVPGLELQPKETVYDAMARDPAAYKAAFWDACGMPLVTTMPRLNDKGEVVTSGGNVKAPDFLYDFQIDTPKCKEDVDLDGYQFSCDNAPRDFNPDQRDVDADGFGDVIDRCVTVPSDNNSADSDKDYLGNDCDLCQRAASTYNKNAGGAPAYMLVRNIPDQSDYDGDGIGDVCDNCIVASNCGDWGNDDPGKQPAKIGDAVPFDNNNICQVDNDPTPFVGDACAGFEPLAGAAGPVGVMPTDDFDQDGLANVDDPCPRQRLKACTVDADCGGEVTCNAGTCANHVDSDGDFVGDSCDTCPYAANPKQIQEGSMQDDDPDGDFVGNPCETNSECYDLADARPIAFYTKVAPSGACCTTTFKEGAVDAPRLRADGEPLEFDEIDALMADYREKLAEFNMTGMGTKPTPPLFVPLSADCMGQTPDKCRQLTDKVKMSPGVVTLPGGCAEAGEPLTLDSPQINGKADELYKFMCTLPQSDQDFDGIGDSCDLCSYSFDPDNSLYKDQNNKVWPNYGKYCRGPWDPEAAPRLESQCGDLSEDMGMGTDTGGDTDTGGGTTGG